MKLKGGRWPGEGVGGKLSTTLSVDRLARLAMDVHAVPASAYASPSRTVQVFGRGSGEKWELVALTPRAPRSRLVRRAASTEVLECVAWAGQGA